MPASTLDGINWDALLAPLTPAGAGRSQLVGANIAHQQLQNQQLRDRLAAAQKAGDLAIAANNLIEPPTTDFSFGSVPTFENGAWGTRPMQDPDTQLPLSPIKVPMAWTDPTGVTKFNANRDAYNAFLRQAALLDKPGDMPGLMTQGKVALAGVPTDPAQQQQANFLTGHEIKPIPVQPAPEGPFKSDATKDMELDRLNRAVVANVPLSDEELRVGQRLIDEKVQKGTLTESDRPLVTRLEAAKARTGTTEQQQALTPPSIGAAPGPDMLSSARVAMEQMPPTGQVPPAAAAPTLSPPQPAGAAPPTMTPPAPTAQQPAPVAPIVSPADRVMQRGALSPERVNVIRNNFESEAPYQQYIKARGPYQSLLELAKRDDPASDLMIIYAIAQIGDPGSAVRETEQQMISRLGTIYEQAKGIFANAVGGDGKLGPEQRINLINAARDKMSGLEQGYNQRAGFYTGIVKEYGGNPDMVVQRFPPLASVDPREVSQTPSANAASRAAAGPRNVRAAKPWDQGAPPPDVLNELDRRLGVGR